MGNLSMPAKLKAWSLELQQFQLLEEEIKFLHRLYCGREAHGHPNPVTTAMLVKHLGVKDSKIIAYQIFAVYDVGGAGVVTFPEFVMALWDFCMEPQESLSEYKGTVPVVNNIVTLSLYDLPLQYILCSTCTTKEVTVHFHCRC